MLKVVTLNLLSDLKYWENRGPLIVDELRALQPDLVALQEVRLPFNNAVWLAERLEGYQVYLCPRGNKTGLKEGIAILSRLPVEDHDMLALRTQNRVAQRVVVSVDNQSWTFVNTHLFWSPFDDAIRKAQMQRILGWLSHDTPTILCGDFNAQPHYQAVKMMHHRFHSAHKVLHGHEPAYTFPTPLERGPGVRHTARRIALRLVGPLATRQNQTWQGTLDYILVTHQVKVSDCRVAFDSSAPGNGHIYPSDHLGLTATLSV